MAEKVHVTLKAAHVYAGAIEYVELAGRAFKINIQTNEAWVFESGRWYKVRENEEE